jgi:hypothetical protein
MVGRDEVLRDVAVSLLIARVALVSNQRLAERQERYANAALGVAGEDADADGDGCETA